MTLPRIRQGAHAAAALGLLLGALPSTAQVLGVNLLDNGDAESWLGSSDGYDLMPVPGWSLTGSLTVVQYGAPEFPTHAGSEIGTGDQNFFTGGPSSALSSATQSVDLSAWTAAIDGGGLAFELSGYLGGFSAQNDNAVFSADFRNALGDSLGTVSIGPVTASDRNNQTSLLYRETSGFIPSGTRSVSFDLLMTRLAGDYDDGYADNLSFVVVPEPARVAGIVAAGMVLWAVQRAGRSSRSGRHAIRGEARSASPDAP